MSCTVLIGHVCGKLVVAFLFLTRSLYLLTSESSHSQRKSQRRFDVTIRAFHSTWNGCSSNQPPQVVSGALGLKNVKQPKECRSFRTLLIFLSCPSAVFANLLFNSVMIASYISSVCSLEKVKRSFMCRENAENGTADMAFNAFVCLCKRDETFYKMSRKDCSVSPQFSFTPIIWVLRHSGSSVLREGCIVAMKTLHNLLRQKYPLPPACKRFISKYATTSSSRQHFRSMSPLLIPLTLYTFRFSVSLRTWTLVLTFPTVCALNKRSAV